MSGKSSARPRISAIAAWLWALIKPGMSAWCGRVTQCRGAYCSWASWVGSIATIRPACIAMLYWSSVVLAGAIGTTCAASIKVSIAIFMIIGSKKNPAPGGVLIVTSFAYFCFTPRISTSTRRLGCRQAISFLVALLPLHWTTGSRSPRPLLEILPASTPFLTR